MTNYIRACFCIKRILDFKDLGQLIEILTKDGCYSAGSPKINLDRWYDQEMIWEIRKEPHKVRLFQLVNFHQDRFMFSFDVDEFIFLPGAKTSYDSDNDPFFASYVQVVINLIRYLRPNIGVLDYDADLLCDELSAYPLASWGNFFSMGFISTWSIDERNRLSRIVDEIVPIDELGVLTFIHPLMANQAWSEHHQQLDELIKHHLENLNFNEMRDD